MMCFSITEVVLESSNMMRSAFKLLTYSCLYLLVLILTSQVSFAAKRTLAISEPIYKEMQKAQLLGEEKKYSQALNVLNKIFEKEGLNDYELAQTQSISGSLYFQQEDYDKAYKAFQKVVQFKEIPDGLYQLTLKTLAQLALVTDRHSAALQYLNELLSLMKIPDSTIHVLIAQAHLSMDDFRAALDPLTKGINLERVAGRRIPENWLLMLNSIYYSLEQYENMLSVLNELVENYPKQQYLVNLAAIYGQLDKTREQLLILEPLYDQGKIDSETLLLNLANLYMLHGTPFKSAKLLSKAIGEGMIESSQRNYEMLAQAWQLSQNTRSAIEPLQKASKFSKNGKVNLQLAQLHFYLYDWRNAEKELSRALKKGGLDDKGNTVLMLGMAQFNQKKYDDALSSLNSAAKYKKSEPLAKQWISYVRAEKQKYSLVE